MDRKTRGRLQGYLLGRSTVLIALLVLAAAFQAKQGGFALPFAWFFAGTACAFAFTLISAVNLLRGRIRSIWLHLQPMWDIAYATVLVFLSGGAFSPFASIYPLAIIGAAILLFRRGSLFAAATSSLAYGLLVDLQFYGLLAPLNPFPLPTAEGEKLLIQLTFNIVAFFAIALLSGFMAEEVRVAGQRLQAAEAEVLDLEHLKESILHSLGSGLVALDPDGRELFHNTAAEEQLGRAGVPLVAGMDFHQVFPLEQEQARNEHRFAASGVILGFSLSPLQDRNGVRRGSILIFQDLTEVRRLEEDLHRADRLAAVGRLAAGLAHEIRNPLASLSGSVEMLRDALPTTDDEAALVEIVLRETRRLDNLVTNFLHYARPEAGHREPVALRELVDETAFFFRQGAGADAFHLDNQIPTELRVAGNRGQLEQLFFNLFRNSLEAAPGGVTVTVDASGDEAQVHLRLADDGPGMAAEAVARAFEPFFSRKEGGTGLGLATVHRVVENHGGTISLHSREGEGARFDLCLPRPTPTAVATAAGDHCP